VLAPGAVLSYICARLLVSSQGRAGFHLALSIKRSTALLESIDKYNVYFVDFSNSCLYSLWLCSVFTGHRSDG